MESLGLAACLPDNLLDLSFDIGEEDDDEYTKPNKELRNASSFLNQNEGNESASLNVFKRDVPQEYEEELEWLENKDSFPTLETVVDVLPNPNISKQQILISILESSNRSTSSSRTNGRTITNHGNSIIMNFCRSIRVPVRARSKRRTRRRDLQNHDSLWGVKENVKTVKSFVSKVINGIKCRHCGAEKTPQWRAGPLGPKTLCNACGVRYKSGRLVPEYRPARSPTFSSELHSNSHRKVLEMRRQKQMMEAELGAVAVKPL